MIAPSIHRAPKIQTGRNSGDCRMVKLGVEAPHGKFCVSVPMTDGRVRGTPAQHCFDGYE